MVLPGEWDEERWQRETSSFGEYKHRRNRQRHRSYCFTLNNPTFTELSYLLETIEAKYFCFGFEVGKKGTQHLQGYVQYHNPTEFTSAKHQISSRAHLEPAKGTPVQNRSYCSKDGDFYEFGDKPNDGGAPKKKTWEELQEVMANPKENISTYNHYEKVYKKIQQQDIQQRKTKTEYYSIKTIEDVISEVHQYFDTIPDLVVITKMEDLAKYPADPQNILLLEDTGAGPDVKELNLYPRGMPICYKYGYEQIHVKPHRFIIETQNRQLFPLYRNI